ncbi:MAG: pilus assembly protein N-terminal domain-containing protein, partial [Planctomycetota bacterium]|nr:pilus assembly protein N-terminal domain-containing protein [Planctomycetota bacterium]
MSYSLPGQRCALRSRLGLTTVLTLSLWNFVAVCFAQQAPATPFIHRITAATEKLEMVANSSRVLSLDQKIPRAQVNNREIVELTPLSPNEIQVFAKKPGVTQINLWNEQSQIHTIDVMVLGDARELAMLLESEFPAASIRVKPLAQSVVLSGFVDRQDHVSQIIRIAEDYYPKVISHITVGGVQQVSLKVKFMEVSRTNLLNFGFDFAYINNGSFVSSGVSGLLDTLAATQGSITTLGTPTAGEAAFRIAGNNSSFNAFMEALRQNNLMKICAEPTLVAVSGRPAQFQVGGEFPVLVPQSLGTVSVDFKPYGTMLDFVAIVLGNGNVRLEVRPEISEIDPATSVSIGGTTIPGLKTRRADTAAELRPGETLAIAGLLYVREEVETRGLPFLGDLPYFGMPFRRVHRVKNEIELVILITPQWVSAVPCEEMPPCGPGSHTELPSDCDLIFRGQVEVPSRGPCGPGTNCGPDGCGPGAGPAMGPGVEGPGPTTAPEEIGAGQTSFYGNRANYNRTAARTGTFDPRTGIAIPSDPMVSTRPGSEHRAASTAPRTANRLGTRQAYTTGGGSAAPAGRFAMNAAPSARPSGRETSVNVLGSGGTAAPYNPNIPQGSQGNLPTLPASNNPG